MEEGLENFFGGFYVETAGIDVDYEFDACRFFDFTKLESDSDIEEAERWFDFAGNYPPSPFVVKLNLEKLVSIEVPTHSSKETYSSNNKSSSSGSDTQSKNGVSSTTKNNAKGKTNLMIPVAKAKLKSSDELYQPRSPTLLRPTISHLLKQHNMHDKCSGHLCTRFHKMANKLHQKGSSSLTGTNNLESKRQKLETGYLRKVAKLKHQFSLLHKSPKKVTVPREPELQTLLRAQNRRTDHGSASSATDKQMPKGCNLPPLNKKAPLLSQPQKTRRKLPDFQFFHSKTKERENRLASAKVYPSSRNVDSSEDGSQKITKIKERSLPKSDELLEYTTIEQFSELSLGSDVNSNSSCQSEKHTSAKVLKKDASSQPVSWRHPAKANQCGSHVRRVNEAKCWPNMTRLRIR